MNKDQISSYNIIIVGAGISGLTLAEKFANELNQKVLVIDKRNHIGGNCYDFINESGVLVPLYGPHFFHTNFEDVWQYVSRFTEWISYEHRVLSSVDGKLVPIPVNMTTVNRLFELDLKNEEEMNLWLENTKEKIVNPKNSEESALARVGKYLYEKMFKEYTKKQWDMWPHELDAEVMDRIPVRANNDDRYFTDKYQAMPKYGYTKLFEKMVENKNINILLNTNWEEIKNLINQEQKIFFTGPIDQFFNYAAGEKLQYRSLKFEFNTLKQNYYQERTSINYPAISIPYTRITEPKHSTGQKSEYTTIIKEYPTWEGEPYYPVPNQRNRDLFSKYQQLAERQENKNIYFVGRLANYKYFNMDQAFKNALELFKKFNYENRQ